MCEWGTWKEVHVKIPADLSHTGGECWKWVTIDACIADIVQALQESGIDMRGSCCNHGQGFGHVSLQDGRVLVITDDTFLHDPFRWGLRVLFRGIVLNARFFVTCLASRLRRR